MIARGELYPGCSMPLCQAHSLLRRSTRPKQVVLELADFRAILDYFLDLARVPCAAGDRTIAPVFSKCSQWHVDSDELSMLTHPSPEFKIRCLFVLQIEAAGLFVEALSPEHTLLLQ